MISDLEIGKLKITKSWPLNSIWYAILSRDPLTDETLQRLQAQAGYLPMGYGFYNVKRTQQESGLWLHTWSSGNSAD